MKDPDILNRIDIWLLDFENEVDAHFSAGNHERGRLAYREWHSRVSSELSFVSDDLRSRFERYDGNVRNIFDPTKGATARSQFMRTCGTPVRNYLRNLKANLQRRSLSR